MLFRLKEKYFHRYIVFIALIILTGLAAVCWYIFSSLYDWPLTPYREAYYFLKKGYYVLPVLLVAVDIFVSAVRLGIREKTGKTEHENISVIRQMGDLLGIGTIAIVLMFSYSPTTLQRFFLVCCDIPNMIMDNTQTIETDDYTVSVKDETRRSRSGTYHTYHYYTVIDGENYMLSENLEQENIEWMAEDYYEDWENGRPEELDQGRYEITYLPISRCVIEVEK